MNVRLLKDSAIKKLPIMAENAVLAAATTGKSQQEHQMLQTLGADLARAHSELKNTSMETENVFSENLSILLKMLEPLCTPHPDQNAQVIIDTVRDQWEGLKRSLTFLIPPDDTSRSNQALPVLDNVVALSREQPADNLRDVIKALYDTILDHPCTCVVVGNSSEHHTRLRLKEELRMHKNDVEFDALVSAEPVLPLPKEIGWRHLRFRVPRPPNDTISRFDSGSSGPALATGLTEDGPESQPIEHGGLCKVFNRDIGPAFIKLRVDGRRLYHIDEPERSEQRLAPSPSMPLSQLLRNHALTPKAKICLAYVLARSIWLYYDSDFMNMRWTTDSIHFAKLCLKTAKERGKPPVDIDTSKPYFVFQRVDNEQGLAEYCKTRAALHKYPRILALCVLLVQICRAKVHNASQEEQSGVFGDNPGSVLQINTEFDNCSDALESSDWPALEGLRNDEAAKEYRKVVDRCSRSDHWSNCGMKERRERLFEDVVRPLERLCSILDITGKGDLIQCQEGVEQLKRPRRSVGETSDANLNQVKYPTASERWLNSAMRRERESLKLPSRFITSKAERIRIAILDTGYDPGSGFFGSAERADRLIKWEDFVESEEWPLDNDGHGTHVVSLAMKIAPAADICVARVAKDSSTLRNSSTNIAQAIDWAANTAKADIVAMSFGFSEEVTVDGKFVISNAITDALTKRNQHILFFAAAANDGGNSPEMFPARHPCAFSIQATDHQGKFLPLNPATGFAKHSIFGTLGKDVPGASRSYDEECRTGTSAATPIAAGVAAMMLGYARVRMEETASFKDAWGGVFWMQRGMDLILSKFSTQMGESKRRYISPRQFMEGNDEYRDSVLGAISKEAKNGRQ